MKIATDRRRRMWPSFETASSIYDWANWFLLGALAMGVVSTGLVVWMGGVKEEYLRRDLSAASERAALAEQKAAEARLALEQFKAPRRLSPEQIDRIADTLKPFAGTVFDAAIGPMGDPEPLYFVRALWVALYKAGWEFIAWTGGGQTYAELPTPPIGLTMVTNVIIDVHPDRWDKFGAAATALAKALNDEGIDAIAQSKSTAINTDAIHVRIGRKL